MFKNASKEHREQLEAALQTPTGINPLTGRPYGWEDEEDDWGSWEDAMR